MRLGAPNGSIATLRNRYVLCGASLYSLRQRGPMEVLEQPAIAVAAGVVAGLITVGLLIGFPRYSPASDPTRSAIATVLGIFLSSGFGLGIIYVFDRVAPASTAWFGVSAVAGFLGALAIYAVRVTDSRYIGKR